MNSCYVNLKENGNAKKTKKINCNSLKNKQKYRNIFPIDMVDNQKYNGVLIISSFAACSFAQADENVFGL